MRRHWKLTHLLKFPESFSTGSFGDSLCALDLCTSWLVRSLLEQPVTPTHTYLAIQHVHYAVGIVAQAHVVCDHD